MVLLEFFWLALQLLNPVLRARAVPSVLSSRKTQDRGLHEATDGLFFMERATVCNGQGATKHIDRSQPSQCHHCNPRKC
ncbi:hypothetical protein FEM01_09195 [Pseudomonas mosselii]|uniref:Uncharacterized protein n=1 Tax=Pseudomonas mosselii TaxID=78327 RepID=A0A5R8Z9G2_9PSED|nr:hypothetical protein FEM01_09195 [Pseudomonas mosselii]